MGIYRSIVQYHNKFARLSGMPQRSERGPQGIGLTSSRAARVEAREIKTIRQEFERLAARLALWVEAKSKRILITEIYQRYIPTYKEYRTLKSAFGGAFVSRSKGEEFRRIQAEYRKNKRFSGTVGSRAEMKAGGQRAWKRFGVLLQAEKGFWRYSGTGDELLIGLRNAAANRRGALYAEPRSNLGKSGHRKNSIWTKSIQWQRKALDELRPKMQAEISRVVQRVFGS